MSTNTLVTAAGGAIGQGIIKSIRLSKLDCRIVTTDVQPYAAGLYRGDAGYLVPMAREKVFVDRIIDICRQEDIHIVLPGTDYELPSFAENKERIERETNAVVAVSSAETIRIALRAVAALRL